MTIVCVVCSKTCCTCQGCQPQLASNGNWVCPNCIGVYESKLNMSLLNKQVTQLPSLNSSPWRQQVITNHMKKG